MGNCQSLCPYGPGSKEMANITLEPEFECLWAIGQGEQRLAPGV